MKNQAECWQALIDGKTLITKERNKIKLVDGFAIDESGSRWAIGIPSDFEIYEPKYTMEQIEKAYNETQIPKFIFGKNDGPPAKPRDFESLKQELEKLST